MPSNECNEELQEETDDAPLGDDVGLSWAEFLSELGVEELETSTRNRFDFGVAGGPALPCLAVAILAQAIIS